MVDFGCRQKFMHRHQDGNNGCEIQHGSLEKIEHNNQQYDSNNSRNHSCFHENLSIHLPDFMTG